MRGFEKHMSRMHPTEFVERCGLLDKLAGPQPRPRDKGELRPKFYHFLGFPKRN